MAEILSSICGEQRMLPSSGRDFFPPLPQFFSSFPSSSSSSIPPLFFPFPPVFIPISASLALSLLFLFFLLHFHSPDETYLLEKKGNMNSKRRLSLCLLHFFSTYTRLIALHGTSVPSMQTEPEGK